MHEHPKRTGGIFRFVHVPHSLIGVSSMHNQWQAGGARSGDVGPKHLNLDITRTKVVVKIQSGLTDPHNTRRRGQRT